MAAASPWPHAKGSRSPGRGNDWQQWQDQQLPELQRKTRAAGNGREGGELWCAGCSDRITGQYVKVDGSVYHPECWRCGNCRKPINGKYFKEKSGSTLCEHCHLEHAPRCFACNQPMSGRSVTALNHSFHPECFACCTCRRQIQGNFFPADSKAGASGGFVCPACHERAHPPEICGGCNRPIKGRSVTADGQAFHPECFSCSKCRRVIDGTFFHSEETDSRGRQLRVCSECQPCCAVCGKGLAGHRSLRIGSEQIHEECFRCSDCKRVIDGKYYEAPETNPFKASKPKHWCMDCQVRSLKAKEDRKNAEEIAREDRRNSRNEAQFKLCWRPELAPDSRKALQDMGMPLSELPRAAQICVCYSEATGHVGVAPVSNGHTDAAVNLAYLACVLRVMRKNRHDPVFSLDPKDPHDLGGPHLVKRFHPEWLAGTVVGEVLFQADYALKQICFGDQAYAELGLPSAFDSQAPVGEERASRQWFKVKNASITVAADGALVPRVELSVETRRLTRCATGYTDAVYTDPRDPMVKQAAAVSERFGEICSRLPVAAELMQLARATVLARFLLSRGCCPDDSTLERYSMPVLPEGGGISHIPTLTKQRTNSSISADGHDGQLIISCQSRSMKGGVDLTVPANKVPVKQLAMKLMDPRVRPVLLPLFKNPSAAPAA